MEHKILITGTVGAGKTTAIRQISGIAPVLTDVTNTATHESSKPTTTAAFDYGEVDLGDGDVLRIYGSPGQERFSFMWPVLAQGALGLVYLVDCSRDEPLTDLSVFIDMFGPQYWSIPSVVALNKLPEREADTSATFQDYLECRGLGWPVVEIDARDQAQVLDVLDLLLSQSEAQATEPMP